MTNITGQRIRELRTEKGITQSELAEILDKTCSAPRMWELGKSMPDAATICKLAVFFGCSSDYLLGISDFKTENEKMEYIDTERIFHSNLENLRGYDKIRLINSLNRYITAYVAAEEEIKNGFGPLSSLLSSFAGMLEEIGSARRRRDSAAPREDNASRGEACEQNAGGIVNIGSCKSGAYDALEEISKQALSVYLNIIKGVCRAHAEDEEEI